MLVQIAWWSARTLSYRFAVKIPSVSTPNSSASVFYLAYVSTAHHRLDQRELADLLATCRRNNSASGVSGALVYADGSFMQVLEGEEAVVRTLFATISRDERHSDLILLDEGDELVREFGRWSMAFRDLTGRMGEVPGFEELMRPVADEGPGRATRLRRLVISARRQLRSAL